MAPEGGSSAAFPTPKAARTALGREMQHTLRVGWEHLTHLPRVEPDPILLIRAARACWLLDDMDAMCVYYREAAVQLGEVVTLTGRRTGTAPDYWRLELGARWMAATYSAEGRERTADQTALRSMGFQVMDTAQRLSQEAGQPLDRMALEMARLRGAWFGADPELDRVLAVTEQRAAAMDTNNRALWAGERDQLTLAALHGLLKERPERMGVPLTQLDEYLTAQMVRPPTVMDLMDEELLALQTAAVKAGVRNLSLRSAPRAGSRRTEMGSG